MMSSPPVPPLLVVLETVKIDDINGAYRELNDSTHIQALKQARGAEVVALVALGAELRATGLEEAPFSSVWHRIHASMACAPTGNTKKLMRLLAPKHAGEFLEVVERLAEASLLALHFDGERVSSAAHGGASLERYNSCFCGMPYLQFRVSPHQVAEELSRPKPPGYTQDVIDAIADRFFPVDDGGLWA